ncbi:pentatricopeptide repeat-containing protein At1g20230 [Eucalyptus grandis]|uniref:pentatricopeptide repeat-containing protein At1g20230 n=1 Tax=Eucalyptus grandis TaxID=71139 RepID=UPI00192ED77A|nr:pentatricopeptide repeat-containing protein At1g20230 [Eucalyptus grandis]
MTGFVRNDKFGEACRYFLLFMRSQGVIPSEVSYIGSALIMMYAKCGSLADATRAFQEIEGQTVVCWSAMITAFQQHGHAERVDEGFLYFNSMSKDFGINPRHEHYACMVDLLGRTGQLDEAEKFIVPMSIEVAVTAWGALLGACANHGNLKMGREVADRLFELQPDNPANYVLLSNMHSREGRLKEADEVRRLMSVNGLKNDLGCSWVDIKNMTFVFTARDRSHPMTGEIYEILGRLEELVKKKGYVPQVRFPVNSIGDYKERDLWYHSERLTLAFALVSYSMAIT